jgi:hypothetical protein
MFHRAAKRSVVGLAVAVAIATAFLGGLMTGRTSVKARTSGMDRAAGLPIPAAPPRPIIVYGDSLVDQSGPYFAAGRSLGLSVTVRASGGLAPCDLLAQLRQDLGEKRGQLVVWAFSGNSVLPCMQDSSGQPLSGAPMLEKYRSDIELAVAAATSAHVPFILVSTPAPRDPGTWEKLDQMYRQIAVAHPQIQYADGGVGIAPGGEYRMTEQCLPWEVNIPQARPGCASATGQVPIRSRDGGHFCTTTANACSGYSSGALRYAVNLVTAARLFLDYEDHVAQTGAAPGP